jgi:hypothetical protein
MSDTLRAAGYSDADLKLHMGDKYKPAQGQKQQAIPADKTKTPDKRKPLDSFKVSSATSTIGIRG